jgi:hypothetical protein
MPALVICALWMYVGFNMIYFLAALQNVDQSLVEAARIDGAGPFKVFLNVTVPQIAPVATFVIVTSTIGSYQLFELPYTLLQGFGPKNSGLTVVGLSLRFHRRRRPGHRRGGGVAADVHHPHHQPDPDPYLRDDEEQLGGTTSRRWTSCPHPSHSDRPGIRTWKCARVKALQRTVSAAFPRPASIHCSLKPATG